MRRPPKSGEPDEHGRTDFGLAPLQPPYVVTQVTPGLFHTQGGLNVDGDGRVLIASGAPITGLFAIGGVAAGISGQAGGRGYASGNKLFTALGLGRLAGVAAAQLRARRRAGPAVTALRIRGLSQLAGGPGRTHRRR